MAIRKSNDEFLKQLKSINPNITPEEEYINSSTKISCHCNICNNSWYVRPNTLLKGYGCPKCAGNIKKSNEKFVEELSLVNSNIEPLEQYQGNKKAILCRCKNCGHKWKASPNNLLSKKHKCPKCSRQQKSLNRRKPNEEFVKELFLINPNVEPLEQYITSQRKIQFRCKICGHIWSTTPNNIISKESKCPQCSHTATSVVEQIIISTFSYILGENEVKSRDRKTIGKELDIVLPNYKFAIEFGAWFWHKNRLSNDNKKQELCKSKGIHLLTIFEDCPNTIDYELIGNYMLFQEEISNENDYHTTKEIIKGICADIKIDSSEVDKHWDKIVIEAISHAQKRTNEEFTKMLVAVNPSVILCEPYTTSNNKLLCKCKTCGNEWKAIPSSLLAGHACPKCARTLTGIKKTISNEEFLSRLKEINPNIEPLDEYTKGNIPIKCKCLVCGNIWSVKPHSLLAGCGCRKCSIQKNAQSQSKKIKCVETGIIYDSISDVYRKTGIYGSHKCAKGTQKTAGGYHWEYVE